MGLPWLDRARHVPVVQLAAHLGLDVAADLHSFAPCPSCGDVSRANPGRRDRRFRCRVFPDGHGWACCSNGTDGCGAMGDGIALVAWTLAGKPWSSGDARTANLVADWFIAKGHCDHLVPPSRSVTHQQLTAAPEPVVPRPPASEVELLWHRCTRVDADPEVRTWLAEVRGFDPQVIADRDLARALPCTGDVPPWATFCGRSWRDTGHRVILPAYEPDPLHPGTLRLASLRARCIRPCEPGDKVGAPAAGQGSATGLVLSMHPGEPLRDGVERQLVTIAEGEPDFIALSLRPASVRGALLGAWSGSAQAAVGALIPAGWTAALLHHADEGGAQQAQVWRKLLEPRGVRCVRLRPPIV